MDFIEKLHRASEANSSLLCIGLDPDPKLMPRIDVLQFNKEIISATSDLVCAYKPNLAFYEALGIEGLSILRRTIEYIPKKIPVIADAKKGDIESSALRYATAIFDALGCDAITVNPYLGWDSVKPFSKHRDKGVFVLCRTSNLGAADFQDLNCSQAGRTSPLYQMVALKAREWNTYGNIGLVVGATHIEAVRAVRDLCPEMVLLIPGIGAQGGGLVSAVEFGVDAAGRKAIFSSSRQILYASKGDDFATAARGEALRLRYQINQCLTTRPR
jgi:orotidine-5'-phosphate decarboxylase